MSSKQHDYSGKSRLMTNIVTSWASQILLVVTGFFMPRMIDEKLGQSLVGIWDFSWSMVSYVALAQLGIGSALNRFVSNYRSNGELDKLQTATTTVTLIQLVLAGFIALTISLISFGLPRFYGDQFGADVHTAQQVMLILGCSLAVQFLFDTSRGILTGSHRWDIYNGLNAGFNLSCSLMMITALYFGSSLITISLIYLAMAFMEGLCRSYVAIRVCPESVFRFSTRSWAFAKTIFYFGMKSFSIGMANIIVVQTTFVMIATTLGPAVLAIFVRPYSLLKHVQTFVTRFTYILTPMAGPIADREGQQELRKFTLTCTRYSFAFALPIMTVFFMYGDRLIYLWMGEAYVNKFLMATLSLGFLLPLAQSPLVRVLIGMDYHGKAAFIAIIGSVILYVPGLLFIQQTGPSVEHFAILLAITFGTVNGIFIPLFACQKLEIPMSRYFKETFTEALMIWIIALIPLLILDQVIKLDGLWVLFNMAIYGVITATLYWLYLLPSEAKKQIGIKLGYA